MRIPAQKIEQVVIAELAGLLAESMGLAGKCGIALSPSTLEIIVRGCKELKAKVEVGARPTIKKLLVGVTVHPDRLELELSAARLAKLIGIRTRSG